MIRTSITREPIGVAMLLAEVASPSHGATVLFVGTVRDNANGRPVVGLEYSAYEAMAAEELERIANESAERWPQTAVVIAHRIGALQLGDTSVAIAAAGAHRDAAFSAARYVIEELKQRVPIWKREQYADGESHWVGAAAADLAT